MKNANTPANPFLPLPVFGSVGKPALERAAEKLVHQLAEDGKLNDSHVLTVQMIIDLARVCGLSADKGSASAVAMASRELREILATLPGADMTVEEEFKAMLAKAGVA
ncbi:hypothetical protein E4U03_10935 [Rothia nasimurium]|uniref:Uncharacterized protein n=1 Tax=Rothia nasimurium TaxID=85336 RepID=A0A4Y9F227_9MICC|nr:hypothetical protein [Rothia nasimurium]MBF0809113.1 hypothetical protein [Rothia nasimurium]TFU20635.1 hypothetical protein E4U03_10935 [Rothia nasimurium]